jgi:nitrite reductase/ring-hydroxylating ferredoxin subunit
VVVERLGRRIVLWRDSAGRAVAQSAHCAHRGADLGLGRVVDGTIQCRFHGFRYAPDGACVQMPCEGRSRAIPRGMRLEIYPVREARGILWLWWGEPRDELPPLPWFDDLPADERHAWTRSDVWRVSFPRVMEGNLDMHHVPFLHHRVVRGFMGPLLDPVDAHLDGDVIRMSGVLREDDGSAYDGKNGVRLELRHRFPGFLAGRLFGTIIVAAMTPIDAARTWMLFRYYVQVPCIGRALAWINGRLEQHFVLSDDERILASSAPKDGNPRGSRLVRADAAVALWHRLYQRSRGAPPDTHGGA